MQLIYWISADKVDYYNKLFLGTMKMKLIQRIKLLLLPRNRLLVYQ